MKKLKGSKHNRVGGRIRFEGVIYTIIDMWPLANDEWGMKVSYIDARGRMQEATWREQPNGDIEA